MNKDFLTQLQAVTSTEEREWLLLEHNLHSLPKKLQNAVWAAAIPHWFDDAFLAFLLPDNERLNDDEFAQLIALSYIESYPERGYCVHERSRALLLRQLWQQDQQRYQQLSTATYQYAKQQKDSDTLWRVEQIYHQLIAYPEQGVEQLIQQGKEWYDYTYNKIELLTHMAREHVDAQRLNQRGIIWTLFWEARLDFIYSHIHSAANKLSKIVLTETTDAYTQASCIELQGDVHLHQGDDTESKQAYAQAYLIYKQIGDRRGEANCMKAKGDVYLSQRAYVKAENAYTQACPIYIKIGVKLGEADCIQALGNIYLHQNDYFKAEQAYIKARLIYTNINAKLGEANCVKAQGNIYFYQGAYNKAGQAYAQAYSIYAEIGMKLGEASCMKAQGDINLYQGNYLKAGKAYTKAFWIYNKIGAKLGEANSIYAQGKLYKVQQQWMLASLYFKNSERLYRTLGLKRQQIMALSHLAEVSLWQADFRQAIQYFQQYERIAPLDAEGQLYLAFTYQCEQQFEPIKSLLKRALKELNKKSLATILHNLEDIAEYINQPQAIKELRHKLKQHQ